MHLYSHGLLHGDMIRPSNNMRKSAPYSEITSTREYPWWDYARMVASFASSSFFCSAARAGESTTEPF